MAFTGSWVRLIPLLLLALLRSGAAQGDGMMESTAAFEKRLQRERMQYNEPVVLDKGPSAIAVFLHAAVGIFKKKRPPGTNETWGYGREILEELLLNLTSSRLLPRATVYVTLLGSVPDRRLAERTLAQHNTSGNLHVLLRGANLYVSELPTIKAMHLYAARVHPRSSLLYFHTKGMRNNGKHSLDWRRYAAHFLIARHALCLSALAQGYHTCGVQLTGEEYVGNFWWSRADWLAARGLDLLESKWNMDTRFAGEDFLLSQEREVGGPGQNVAPQGQAQAQGQGRHRCLFFVQHNLYDCPTPPELYEHVPLPAPASPGPDGGAGAAPRGAGAAGSVGAGAAARRRARLEPAVTSGECPKLVQMRGSAKDNHGGTCIASISAVAEG